LLKLGCRLCELEFGLIELIGEGGDLRLVGLKLGVGRLKLRVGLLEGEFDFGGSLDVFKGFSDVFFGAVGLLFDLGFQLFDADV
jgi:hypothetical protein